MFLKICVEYDVEDIEIMEERLLAELEAQANILNNIKSLKFKDNLLFLKCVITFWVFQKAIEDELDEVDQLDQDINIEYV